MFQRDILQFYVGESEMKRFVIPVSFLNEASFQELLSQAVGEFGFHRPMGGLTIPCRDETLVDIASRLSTAWCTASSSVDKFSRHIHKYNFLPFLKDDIFFFPWIYSSTLLNVQYSDSSSYKKHTVLLLLIIIHIFQHSNLFM